MKVGGLALVLILGGVAVGSRAQEGSFLENQGQAYAPRDTPELRQARLAQAIALRDEALQLQAADGGSLSAAHLAQIRARAKVVRGEVTPATGSLITRQ